MSSIPNKDAYGIETEKHVSGAGVLNSLDQRSVESEVEEYLERLVADVEPSGSNQNYDFDIWTANGSHASVSYIEEESRMYLGATGGEMAVDTVLKNTETDGYMKELEDIWF